jgi:DNA-binding transcriptional ArsR family regulator
VTQSEQHNNSDFTSKYVQLLSKITDAPQEFQEAAALFLLSTVVGRKWVFRSIPETSIFLESAQGSGKLLNMWFIFIGKSRITRKTSGVMNHVAELSRKILGTEKMITEAFTPEALIEQMAGMSEPFITGEAITVCFWISDEIAWFFQHLRKQNSYMATADAFLSKMYDGNDYRRATRSKGEEIVWKPYLTVLLASTDYLPTLFDELQIRLGFLNRFVFVIGERKERKPLRTDPLTDQEKTEVQYIEDYLKALAERSTVTMLEMTDEAKQSYDLFEKETEDKIQNEKLGLKDHYCAQLPNLVVRIACLFRLSRMRMEEIRDFKDPTLKVEKQDVENAIEYAWKAWDWFEKVIDTMKSTESTNLRPKEMAKNAIIEFLSDGAEKHVNEIKDYVIKRTGVSPATFYSGLRELREAGKIRRPRPDYYKVAKDEEKNAEGEKK